MSNSTSGDFFSQDQYDRKSKVAIIGANVATDLFPDQDPIGQKIRMSNTVFTVIGAYEKHGYRFYFQR